MKKFVVTDQDREFLGVLTHKAPRSKYDLDDGVKQALAREVRKEARDDATLMTRTYDESARALLKNWVNNRDLLFKQLSVLVSRSRYQIYMQRLRAQQDVPTASTQRGFNVKSASSATIGELRSTWDYKSLSRLPFKRNTVASSEFAASSVSRTLQPRSLARTRVEQLAGQLDIDSEDASQLITPEFIRLINQPEFVDLIAKHDNNLLEALSNTRVGNTALISTAIQRGDRRAVQLAELSSAGNLESIAYDNVDLQLIQNTRASDEFWQNTAQQTLDTILQRTRPENVFAQDADDFGRLLDSSYGSSVHALARQNLVKIYNILDVLARRASLPKSSIVYTNTNEVVSSRVFRTASVVFELPGRSSDEVLELIRELISNGRINIGIAMAINSHSIVLTLPFYHNDIYVKNSIIKQEDVT